MRGGLWADARARAAQPEKEIIVEFIKNDDYKYVRALGAYYLRLTGKPSDVYQYLEPLYNDNRKLRRRLPDGAYVITHMDEFIEVATRLAPAPPCSAACWLRRPIAAGSHPAACPASGAAARGHRVRHCAAAPAEANRARGAQTSSSSRHHDAWPVSSTAAPS